MADALLSLIRKVEANGRYDAFFAFRIPKRHPIDMMTLGEVRAYQEGFTTAGGKSSAAGAYQIIRKTLEGLVRDMRLSWSSKFDRDMQDAMAMHLLERRGLRRYQDGEISLDDFAHEVAKEWASFPRVLGNDPERSYYAGDGLNKALVSINDVRTAIAAIPAVQVDGNRFA